MYRRILSGLFCALFCVLLFVPSASALEISGIGGGNVNLGEVKENEVNQEDGLLNNPLEEIPVEIPLVYSRVELNTATKDFIATLDDSVTITLISSQKDFVDGYYVEHFNDFYADDKKYYHTFINTLKTISELNGNVKLQFIDPFSVSSYEFLDKYDKYDLKYGDLFINCYSNFEGTSKPRRAVIELNELFEFSKDGKGGKKISGVKIEKTLIAQLDSLRHFRNINVAYISDLCNEANIQYLQEYLKGKRYSFDSITLKDERLNGYDMIMIASPVRDLMLEEVVILNAFLDNGGAYGKTLMYFCPESYVRLPNLHSFLNRWGVAAYEKYKLVSPDKNDYFAKNSQLLAKSTGTDYSKRADADRGSYIMDNCTPLRIVGEDDKVKVKALLKTASDKTIYIPKREDSIAAYADRVGESFPLVTLSQITNEDGVSGNVVTFASVDFITTYFARQTPKIDKDFPGELNCNFKLTYELLEKLNKNHRSEESGLGKYAVSLADMGYDTTSGLKTQHILQVAIISVALFIIIFVGLLALFAKKHKQKTDNQ